MTARYRVLVDDNAHYQDLDHRHAGPEFDALDEAVAYCKRLVERFLMDAYRNGMSVEALIEQYQMFGEDPFIAGDRSFSAWDYAHSRASAICAGKQEKEEPL